MPSKPRRGKNAGRFGGLRWRPFLFLGFLGVWTCVWEGMHGLQGFVWLFTVKKIKQYSNNHTIGKHKQQPHHFPPNYLSPCRILPELLKEAPDEDPRHICGWPKIRSTSLSPPKYLGCQVKESSLGGTVGFWLCPNRGVCVCDFVKLLLIYIRAEYDKNTSWSSCSFIRISSLLGRKSDMSTIRSFEHQVVTSSRIKRLAPSAMNSASICRCVIAECVVSRRNLDALFVQVLTHASLKASITPSRLSSCITLVAVHLFTFGLHVLTCLDALGTSTYQHDIKEKYEHDPNPP